MIWTRGHRTFRATPALYKYYSDKLVRVHTALQFIMRTSNTEMDLQLQNCLSLMRVYFEMRAERTETFQYSNQYIIITYESESIPCYKIYYALVSSAFLICKQALEQLLSRPSIMFDVSLKIKSLVN